MKIRTILAIAATAFAMTFTSCTKVSPNADEEAVLIMKPWFFGHGGVDPTPVKTGLTWCCLSTSAEYFKIAPQRYDIAFDDIMSNNNTPLDYATYVVLQVEEGKSPVLMKNYGVKWFENNVEAAYRNFVREEISKYNSFDLMSNREVCNRIDSMIMVKMQKHFQALSSNKEFPVLCKSVITGRAKPNAKQQDEMENTAAAIQAKETQDRKVEMEKARAEAEKQRAIADKAYMVELNLTPSQFIQLKAWDIIKDKEGANIDVLISPTADPMWNIRR